MSPWGAAAVEEAIIAELWLGKGAAVCVKTARCNGVASRCRPVWVVLLGDVAVGRCGCGGGDGSGAVVLCKSAAVCVYVCVCGQRAVMAWLVGAAQCEWCFLEMSPWSAAAVEEVMIAELWCSARVQLTVDS